MTKKFATTLTVAVLILASAAALGAVASQSQPQPQARPEAQPHAQPQAQSEQLRSATGKVTSVSGQRFAIEMGEGERKQTIEFITDSATATSGQLRVGSTVSVQYRPGSGGQNMATKVDVQS